MSRERKAKRQITISSISDMEDNPASLPMVQALATRIDGVIREMGLSAEITLGPGNLRRGKQESRQKLRSQSSRGGF